MEHVSPVVNFKSLPSEIISDRCRLLPTTLPPMGWLSVRFKLSNWGLKKQTTGSLPTKLSRFLFHYRLTPNATTGIAPAELLLSRKPKSHIDFMTPHSLRDRVQEQQQKQKYQHDQHAKPCTYKQGELVFVQDFCRQTISPWSPGTIVQSCSGQSYKVKLSNDQMVQRQAVTFINAQLAVMMLSRVRN